MGIDRKHIGSRTPPYTFEVEKGQLQFFAKATGERNPIFFDEVAARRAGYRALPAPPTFAFGMTFQSPRDLAALGVDMPRALHGEQVFRHHAQIYAGDRITLVGEITDIFEKKGGALEFVVERTRATNQDGVLCVEMEVTTVIRHD